MDKEYLADYEAKENEEYDRLVTRRIEEGIFNFQEDKYPPDKRFKKLQYPVTEKATGPGIEGISAQIPFTGTVILSLDPCTKSFFEKTYFPASKIEEVIQFIKDTGKMQICLSGPPSNYENLDFLEPIFCELNPPCGLGIPESFYGSNEEINQAYETFDTLARISYQSFMKQLTIEDGALSAGVSYVMSRNVYAILKLRHYYIAEEIENLLIDNASMASELTYLCLQFITLPLGDLRCDSRNYSFELASLSSSLLPPFYRPEMRFPCEIGKFLIKEKLTRTPLGLDACREIIDYYSSYDLYRVMKSLNEAITEDHPDAISKSRDEFSEILDNAWNDQTVSKRVRNIKRGLPISIAAIGPAISSYTKGLEGFLAGLGFAVGSKFLDVEISGISEKIAKFLSRSYQANIFDFKKKYKERLQNIQR